MMKPKNPAHCSLRLILCAIVTCQLGVLASIGVCCSSWVVASRVSTGRSWLTPMGRLDLPNVLGANLMVARTVGWESYFLIWVGMVEDDNIIVIKALKAK